MDPTAWVELRTLSKKDMIPAIHYNLLAPILRRLDKIEAATAYARPQWEPPSSVGSLTTASRTKAALSAAASVPPTPPSETDAITPMIPRSLRLLGASMVVELIHADHCFECRDLQGQLSSWLSMHVPVVGGIETPEETLSTSAKQAQPSSAGRPEAGHVKSPFSELSDAGDSPAGPSGDASREGWFLVTACQACDKRGGHEDGCMVAALEARVHAATGLYEALRMRMADFTFAEGEPRPNPIHAARLWDEWQEARQAIADYETVNG